MREQIIYETEYLKACMTKEKPYNYAENEKIRITTKESCNGEKFRAELRLFMAWLYEKKSEAKAEQ